MSQTLLGKFNFSDLKVIETKKVYTPPADLAQKIEKTWQEGLIKYNNQIWNGVNYRLDKIETSADSSPILHIGITEFKANFASGRIPEEVLKYPFELRPNTMGIGGLIVTSDQKFILGQTPGNSIHGQKLDLFGGGLNQDELEIHSSEDILKSLYKEYFEEINLSEEYIDHTDGVGIYETPTCRIIIVAITFLNQTLEQIQTTLKMNDEHEQILILNKSQLINLPEQSVQLTNGIRLIIQDYFS